MKCDKNGFDTHPDIISLGCRAYFVPKSWSSGHPCRFYKMCQEQMREMTENDPWAKGRHEEYLRKKAEEK